METARSSGGDTGCRHVAHPVAGAIPQDEAAPGISNAGVRTIATWQAGPVGVRDGDDLQIRQGAQIVTNGEIRRRGDARKSKLRPR